jgi:hypothetical protein
VESLQAGRKDNHGSGKTVILLLKKVPVNQRSDCHTQLDHLISHFSGFHLIYSVVLGHFVLPSLNSNFTYNPRKVTKEGYSGFQLNRLK